MSRLIIIPQYPAKLRYQEWWIKEFELKYASYFDEVLILGPKVQDIQQAISGQFSPIEIAIQYELDIIKEYLSLTLRHDDVLLLNDLSFPGLFANVLFHKKPDRCFAICHATSKNKYDLFQPVRKAKFPSEKAVAKLFDKVFVASEYHAKKLGWDNLHVVRLPNIPVWMRPNSLVPSGRNKLLVCASRPNIQKTTRKIEKALERRFKTTIQRPNATYWMEYFQFLYTSKFLLITAKEETYGYQIVDALLCGCIPLAPRKLSYPELLPDHFLYSSFQELVERIEYWKYKTMLMEMPKERFFQNTADIMQQGV